MKSDSKEFATASTEIFELAGSLNSAADLDDLLGKIGEAAERLSDSEASSILLVTEDKKDLYFRVALGDKARAIKRLTIPIGQGIAGAVAKNLKPEMINDPKADPRFSGKFDKASGFQTRSLLCVPMIFQDELVGVLEVLNKRTGPYTGEDVRLLSSLASLASVSVVNTKVIGEQKNFFSHVLEILSASIESSRPNMMGHPARSARLACAIGRQMGLEGYDYRMLYYAGLLHDIGYVALKNSRLLSEWGISQPLESLHPELSIKMLEGIKMIAGAIPLIRHHHESFDGKGFPSGIKGEEIALGARILNLVEAVEDLRMAGGEQSNLRSRAVKEVQEGAGTRFDPRVAEAFASLMDDPEGIW